MATKKKNRKKGGRKLEFAIYIAGVLLVCLIIFGIVQGVRALFGNTDPSETDDTSSTGSSVSVVVESEESASSATADSTVQSTAASAVSSAPAASSADTASSKPAAQTTSSKASPKAPKAEYVTRQGSGAEELNAWYMILVNGESLLPKNFSVKLSSVGSEQIDSRILSAYNDMVAAAKADGVTIYALSGYRSVSTQTRLYNNRVDRAKRENPSFNQKQAEDYAATHVARPYTSEHHTGLAIDFNSVEQDFGYTKAGKWLKAHANDYGFILRYEEDKQSKTGVIWEPWHYRFVGVYHAKRMTQLGYCMEEYVEYLKNGGK